MGEDDFEVIPIPACFNLEVPFEIVQDDTEPELDDENEVSINCGAVTNPIELDQKSLSQEEVVQKLVGKQDPQQAISLESNVDKLVELGFGNRDNNMLLLEQHNNMLDKVLEIVYKENDTQW